MRYLRLFPAEPIFYVLVVLIAAGVVCSELPNKKVRRGIPERAKRVRICRRRSFVILSEAKATSD